MSEAAIFMRSLLLLTLAAGSIAITSQARIGYTLDQCVKEYGPYKIRQSWCGTVYDFQVNGERLGVVLQKDLVSAIDYNKPAGAKFDINEIDELLDKNKGTSTWGAPDHNLTDDTEHFWLTTSGPPLVAHEAGVIFSFATKTQYDLDMVLWAKQERDALATENGAKRYIQNFYKSTGSSATVNSSSTFAAKTLSNANYLLAKVDLNLSETVRHYVVGVILTLDKDERITETQTMEESKFYKFVTTGDTALLNQEANLDVNAKPTSTPTPEIAKAPTVNRDKLKQMIAVPTSDMSSLSREEVEEAAQLDAQSYYVTHKQKTYAYNVGVARALKHNLLGDLALHYQVSLYQTLEALAADDATPN
jgi:hypothetical protein